MASKGTATQSLISMLAGGLEQAGYAAMLSPGRKSWDSLRPAIEAYTTYHGMTTDAPLENLVKRTLLPRCDRPDVDYLPDGQPMPVPTQPDAATIEAFLAGDLEAHGSPRVEAATTPTVATISISYAAIPDRGDRLVSTLDVLNAVAFSKYPEVCGLSWKVVSPSERANVRATSAIMGPMVLGMAIVGPPGGIASVSDQWLRMNPLHAWDDGLYWTTLTHEAGHSCGMGHIRGGIMGPVNDGATEWGPKATAWLREHYGPPEIADDGPEPPMPIPLPVPPGDVGHGTATFVAPDGWTYMVAGPFYKAKR